VYSLLHLGLSEFLLEQSVALTRECTGLCVSVRAYLDTADVTSKPLNMVDTGTSPSAVMGVVVRNRELCDIMFS
jgi:hypothetical protein